MSIYLYILHTAKGFICSSRLRRLLALIHQPNNIQTFVFPQMHLINLGRLREQKPLLGSRKNYTIDDDDHDDNNDDGDERSFFGNE